MKQILLATTLYVGDHDDRLPFPNWGRTRSAGFYAYSNNINGISNKFQIKGGQIFSYLSTSNMYRCPLDFPAVSPAQRHSLPAFVSHAENWVSAGALLSLVAL